MYSLDPATGNPNWGPTKLKQTVYADPTIINDTLFIVTRDGNLITLDDNGLPTTVAKG